jgi:polyisoprenoid-binding protein YceI
MNMTGRTVVASGALAGIAGLAALSLAAASGWQMKAANSSVTMYATKQGEWFNGTFADFTAEIVFDPANPGAGSIVGVVQTNSIETEDPQNAAYVRQYLEVEAFPEARFESTAIVAIEDYFQATADLTLRGVTKPVTMDFAFSNGPEAHFSGQMTIDRYEFGIAGDVDPSRSGRDVTVQVELDLSE